jgi:hypothetical protein
MTYHRSLICFALALAPALLTPTAPVRADETFAPVAVISMPGGQKIQSFDISFVDPVIGIYVLGDRTNFAVDVIDTTTNTVLTQLPAGFIGPNGGNNDGAGPDGVPFVGHHEAWAGDGNSTVKVSDLFSQHLTHTISTGGVNRADELCFDPRHHLVMVANNADSPPFASIISTTTYAVVKKIVFDGTHGAPNSNNGAEQCQWDHRTGKFYISIPGIVGQPAGTGGAAVIDPVTLAVETTFIVPLASYEAPQGLTIGRIIRSCSAATVRRVPTIRRRSSTTATVTSSRRSPMSRAPMRCGTTKATATTSWRDRRPSAQTNYSASSIPTRPVSDTTTSPAAKSRRMRTL